MNESELVTNEVMSVDSTSDSNASDSTDALKPEKPKSVYDLASEHVDDLTDGLYTFGSSVNCTFVLDVPGGTTSAGRKLQLYSENKTNAQVWRVSHDQNGFVVIASVKGCTLDVPGGSASNRNPVQLWSDNGTLAQRWVAIKETDGSYTFISALNQSFAIDVAGGVAANGSAVQLYEANGTAAQRWVLTPAKTEQQQLDDRAAAHLADLPDGTYAMLASNDSFALITDGGSLSFDKFGYSGVQRSMSQLRRTGIAPLRFMVPGRFWMRRVAMTPTARSCRPIPPMEPRPKSGSSRKTASAIGLCRA